MKKHQLPPEDLASTPSFLDRSLLLQLEEAVSKQFFASCDRITQTFLNQCQWILITNLDVPTLTITCPDAQTYWNIIGNIENITQYLSRIIHTSRIEVIPKDEENICVEVEISV
jgi:hypothetical protein